MYVCMYVYLSIILYAAHYNHGKFVLGLLWLSFCMHAYMYVCMYVCMLLSGYKVQLNEVKSSNDEMAKHSRFVEQENLVMKV